MKVVTRDGRRELVPVLSELQLGIRMYQFEANMVLLGLRPPLPHTPRLSDAKNGDEINDRLKHLYLMYGDVTEELLDQCLPEVQSARWKDRYMKYWRKMENEDTGSL